MILAALVVPGAAAAEAVVESAPQAVRPVTSLARGEAYTHLMRAFAKVRRGEVGSALEEIDRAIELVPDSPDLLTESAELLLKWTGRVSEAERMARRAREIDPQHAGALRFLADLAAGRALGPERDLASGQEAIGLYEQLAGGQVPADPGLLQTLVQLRIQGGDFDGAVLDVKRLVAERPGDLLAAQTLAQLLLRSNREMEALEVLLDYVVAHPTQDEILGWAEQLASSQQGWPAVVEFLDARGPFEGEATLLNRFYGEALLRVGRMAEAARVLELAVDVRPHDLKTRKDLALAYRGMGRMADAAGLFRDLTIESPEYPLLQQLLAETLVEQNDIVGAVSAFESALAALVDREDVAPSYRDAIRQRMAMLYLERDRQEKTRAVLGELEMPEGPLALEIRCRLAIQEEDWDEARKLARRLADEGKEGRALLREGEIAAREKKWAKASSRFAEAVEALGEYQRATVAEIYREAGRPDEGEVLLREWVDAEPELADARFHLGVFYYEIERFEEADRELREAFRLEPTHARALNFLGYSLAERKMHLDEALGMIERALDVDSWNGAYLDSLGWVYYQMGRFAEAREPLELAAREYPKDPIILEHLGDVYLSLNERALAIAAWARALEAGPEDPVALRGKVARASAHGEDATAEDTVDGSPVIPEKPPM